MQIESRHLQAKKEVQQDTVADKEISSDNSSNHYLHTTMGAKGTPSKPIMN